MRIEELIYKIDTRYTDLANKECCLSCGGALNFAMVKPGEICIDLGSGRGTDVIRMSEQTGNNGFVYGIDISTGMIEKSLQLAERLGVNNVKFIHSALEKIPLPTNIADVILSNCTINHSLDKQKVWDEIYRLLKVGGRFIVSDIYAVDSIAEQYRNDPIAIAECWAGAVTREEYLQHLKNAGFDSVQIIEESKPYSKGKALVASWTIKGIKPNFVFNK